MKTLIVLILFCAACYGSDISTTNVVGDITTVISERQDTSGKQEVRIETVYRGKVKILQVISRPNKQGKLTVVSRSYFAGNDLLMAETDHDGDGIFEHVFVCNPTTGEIEL